MKKKISGLLLALVLAITFTTNVVGGTVNTWFYIPTPPMPEPVFELVPEPEVPVIRPDIDPSRPMVALTFDDGPSKHTARILDLLEKHGGRATFFVVGNLVEPRRDTIERAHELGFEILGHSWDHSDLTKLSADAIKKQLLSTADIIEDITGVRPHSFRPPYGAVNDTVKKVSRDLGFGIINWSVDTLDWKHRNADYIYNVIMKDARDRTIILNHDLYVTTADAMERVIPELISRGYQLVTISELLYFSNMEIEPGKVIYRGN